MVGPSQAVQRALLSIEEQIAVFKNHHRHLTPKRVVIYVLAIFDVFAMEGE